MATIRSCSRVSLLGALLGAALLGACDDSAPVGEDELSLDVSNLRACAAERAEIEEQLTAAFDVAVASSSITTTHDATLLLETSDGRRFTREIAPSSSTTPYASASTSKLVTAVVILDLVDQGVLHLDDTAHDLIPFWTDERSVTLRDLLSFTSGIDLEPGCIDSRNARFEDCVRRIYEKNVTEADHPPPPPGTQFTYASTHMQIAGLMAVNAVNNRRHTSWTWTDVFDDWKARTGLFPHGVYDLPSTTNPRLSGGMHWNGEEYLALLHRLERGTLLTAASRAALFGNQRNGAVVSYSPVWMALHEDWSYGLGNWLECPTATHRGSFDCDAGHRNSSPGAYGAYPFIDFEHHYVGMVARQGDDGTFREGLAIFREVESLAEAWADHRCR